MTLWRIVLILLIIAGLLGALDDTDREFKGVFALIFVASAIALFLTFATPYLVW